MASRAKNRSAVALSVLLAPLAATAGDWKFDPKFSVSERFTDNVALSATNKESTFITEINPGFTLTRKGGKGELSVDYSLQGLLYSHDSGANDLHNQLSARLHMEPLDGQLFIDADARVAQQNTSSTTSPVSSGNYNTTGNRTETYALSVTPSWRSRFGSTAQFDARWQLTYSGSDNAATLASTQGSNLSLTLNSGSAFHKTPWGVSYRLQFSDGANSTQIGSLSGNIGYKPTPKTRVTLTLGKDSNNQNTTGFNQASGAYWTVGASWDPTSRTKLEATVGHRYNGDSYGLNLSQKTRKTTWVLRYSEDITDAFSQLTGLTQTDVYVCSSGVFFDPQPNDPTCVFIPNGALRPVTSLINDVSLNKTWSAGVTWQHGKSTVTGSLNKSHREQISLLGSPSDETTSLSGAWNWRINPRVTSNIALTLSESNTATSQADTWSLGWTLSRKLSAKATGSLELRHYEGDSNAPGVGNYEENSAAARLNMSF